jgi:hypothetical protein
MHQRDVITALALILFLIPFVYSAQPQVLVPQASQGISIEHPISEVIPANVTHKFHFHLFNSTDGKPFPNTTSSIVCVFHLYNPDGSHIVKVNQVLSDDTWDWEQIVLAGNFSKVGQYSYVFQCNNTLIGGFYGNVFLVTKNGYDSTTAESLSYVLMTLIILSIFLMVLFFQLRMPYKGKNKESPVSHWKYLKVGLTLITYPLFLWLINILVNVSDNFQELSVYYGFFSFAFKGLIALSLPLIIIIIVWYVANIIHDQKVFDQVKRFGRTV